MYPIFLLQAILVQYLGLGFSQVERILYFFPFPFVAVFSMYYLSYVLFGKRSVCFFSSLLYVYNSHILWRAASGGITLAMAGGLAPLALAFIVKGLEDRDSTRYGILSGFTMAVSLFYEVRIAYLTLGLIMSYLLFNLLRKSLSGGVASIRRTMTKSIKVFAMLTIVASSLNAFWFLPAIFARTPVPPYRTSSPASLSFSSFETVLALSWQLWPYPIVWPAVVVITILVFFAAALLLRHRNAKVTYLFVLYLLCAFLAKGTLPPLGEVYAWLFVYFPGFSAFREPLKFLFAESIPYVLLFGVAIESIGQLAIAAPPYPNTRKILRIVKHLWKIAWPAAALILLLVNASPVLTDQVPGTFQPTTLSKNYQTMDQMLGNMSSDYRTLWFPNEPVYIPYDREHPAVYAKSEIFSSDFDNYFLGNVFFQNKTDFFSKILGLDNVKYIIVSPESEASWVWHPQDEHSLAVSILRRQIGISEISTQDGIHLYENDFALPHFYATSHAALIVGGRNTLTTIAPYANFSRYVFLFADQLKSASLNDVVDMIVFSEGKDMDDLLMAMMPDEFRINLWQYARYLAYPAYESQGRWIRGSPGAYLTRIWVQELGEIPESPDSLVEAWRDSHAEMRIPRIVADSGLYDLWLRVGFDPTAGSLGFRIDNQEGTGFSCVANQTVLKWVKLGSYRLSAGLHTLSLLSNGENVMDELVIIPHDSYLHHKDGMVRIIEKRDLVYLDSNRSTSFLEKLQKYDNIPVHWNELNPTEYELTIDLTQPAFLVFSERYDPMWVARMDNGQETRSIVANSAFNSFLLHNVGKVRLTVVFNAQQYVSIGLLISTLAAIFGVTYLVAVPNVSCRSKAKDKRK